MQTVSGIAKFQHTSKVAGVAKTVTKETPKTPENTKSESLKSRTKNDLVQLGNTDHSNALIPNKVQVAPTASASDEVVLIPEELPKSDPVSPTPPKEEAEELTNWILESANSTPYAKSEHIGLYRERMPRFPKDMRASFDEALLNAIATDEIREGQAQLKDLSSTMKWSLKFKKDAGKVHSESGFDGLRTAALEAETKASSKEQNPLDKVLASDSLLFNGKLPRARAAEANKLLTQHLAGNENPGIGNKTLGKGVCYLRGRKGTRIFYREKNGKTEWLAVCDKTNEPKAIAKLRRELDLR